jgi:3-oxoacyl-[acyl-carrier protein] reductase
MKVLDGQVALVTGGSRGIGKSICMALATAGAKVYVNYASRSDAALETVKEIEEAGGVAEALGFNVADADSVEEAFKKIKENDSKIDILVNNAGVTYNGVFIRMKDEDWNSVVGINLNGAYNCCKQAAKLMMKARIGRIVNISSVVAEMGNPGQAPYVASKAGLIGLTKSLAKELAVRNITVNAITPGFIQTEMTSDLPEDLKAEHLKAIPLGEYGNPEDIANAVVFLASPQSKYITGQVLGVNGGMYM